MVQGDNEKEYALLNDSPGWHHHKGAGVTGGKSPTSAQVVQPEVHAGQRAASRECAQHCPTTQPGRTGPHSPFGLGFQSFSGEV